jgi:hypothetical protein
LVLDRSGLSDVIVAGRNRDPIAVTVSEGVFCQVDKESTMMAYMSSLLPASASLPGVESFGFG